MGSDTSNDPVRIQNLSEAHLEGMRRAVDAVARERRYLRAVHGFSPEETADYYRSLVATESIALVALAGSEVVAWCDVRRLPFEGFAHTAVLGMGVVAGHRGRGLGRRLLEEALRRCRDQGLTRIELDVLASNEAAIHLYERSGFVLEGRKRRARILDGEEDDLLCMARLLVPGD